MQISRRNFIKLSGASGLTLLLSGCHASGNFLFPTNHSDISPIDRTLPDIAAADFFGDTPTTAHSVLWNKAGFLSSNPLGQINERVPLVVIGGGMAGLASAYLLREQNPILLEQAARFGGNSKGQSWRDIAYSIGAAYIVAPEPESKTYNLLNELNIVNSAFVKTGEDPVALNQKVYSKFWEGETTEAKSQFETLREYFLSIFNEEIPYPNIPPDSNEGRRYINELDNISFLDHLRQKVGGKLHPHIEVALQHYCWSSLGGTAEEISAACGLNFYAAEFGDLWVFPGGNSFIAETFLSKLQNELPSNHIRPSSLVFDVEPVSDGVNISYLDNQSKVNRIQAKAVVMATPKFIAKHVIQGLEESRLAAINQLRYRSYLVANICLTNVSLDKFYDLYLLGDGADTSSDRESVHRQGVTDVVLANFTAAETTNNTVLTLYKALPFDGARAELLAPGSYAQVREQFETQVVSEILPLLSIDSKAITDVRIARWGHPLPLAAKGQIQNEIVDEIRRPFRDRVFFVEQDNWALPAFETSIEEALYWSPKIKELLT